MQFVYHPQASKQLLEIDGELFTYLIKVKRSNVNDLIHFRNLSDDNIYTYILRSVNKKSCQCSLLSYENMPKKPKKYLHILWCLIDPKIIEKELPTLNQIGVSKISFVYCDYSQHHFKLNINRLNNILTNSCSQCGRSDLMELCIISKKEMQMLDFAIIDFHSSCLSEAIFNYNTFLIGPEGGFSKEERIHFASKNIFSFDSNLILRSETAVSSLASIYLLS